jgi:hypothetical protein
MSSITVETHDTDRLHERLAPRLPSKARMKLERWRAAAADADALRYADSERLIELRNERAAAQRELAELERADKAGKLYRELRVPDEKSSTGFRTEQVRDVARLEAVTRRIQTAQDQIERLQSRMAHREATPLRACGDYLQQLPPHVELTEHDAPPATTMPGENFPSAIARTRAAILDLLEEGRAVALAPLPAVEVKLRVRREIEALAAAGRPGVLAVAERAGRVRWPSVPLAGVELTTGSIPQLQNAFALIAWLEKDKLIGAMDQLVDEDTDDTHALTDSERAVRLSDIAAELLRLERQEEDFCEQAEAEGETVSRRHDADARAVLGLSDRLPAPRKS